LLHEEGNIGKQTPGGLNMAPQSGTYLNDANIPFPVLLKVLSIILLSVLIVPGILSPISSVALANRPQVIDAPYRLPRGEACWSARTQEQAGVYADEETGGQPIQEAWSARYQKQVEAYAEQQFSLERGRQAWSARYQFQ
jgi:hypothetical protein